MAKKPPMLTTKEWAAVVSACALFPEHHMDEINMGDADARRECEALDRAFYKIREAMTTEKIRGDL